VKKRYKTIITQRLFEDALSNTPSTLDLYQACVLINRVWAETKASVIQHCFAKAWGNNIFDKLHVDIEFESKEQIEQECQDLQDFDEKNNEQTRVALTEQEIVNYVLNKYQKENQDEQLEEVGNELGFDQEDHDKLRESSVHFLLEHAEMIPFVTDLNELAEDRILKLTEGDWGGSESLQAVSTHFECPIAVHDIYGQITWIGKNQKLEALHVGFINENHYVSMKLKAKNQTEQISEIQTGDEQLICDKVDESDQNTNMDDDCYIIDQSQQSDNDDEDNEFDNYNRFGF
ncbi:MAG: hypothetical protein EZS28_003081, partial [Streblomastix strix]